MKALDLYCGAGGATRGLQQASFHVVGIDLYPQPNYIGDRFIQADVLSLSPDFRRTFDFIWSSPPARPSRRCATCTTPYLEALAANGAVRIDLDGAVVEPVGLEHQVNALDRLAKIERRRAGKGAGR